MKDYQTGFCNIGTEEKRLRRRFGYIGTIITILGIFVILGLRLEPILSLLLFFPIYSAVIGFYQDRNNFCVAFGFSGLYNMAEDTRDIKKVQDEIKRKTDRKKAIKMSLVSLVISIVITVGILSFNFLIL
jgi:uncharacterized membrane protein